MADQYPPGHPGAHPEIPAAHAQYLNDDDFNLQAREALNGVFFSPLVVAGAEELHKDACTNNIANWLAGLDASTREPGTVVDAPRAMDEFEVVLGGVWRRATSTVVTPRLAGIILDHGWQKEMYWDQTHDQPPVDATREEFFSEFVEALQRKGERNQALGASEGLRIIRVARRFLEEQGFNNDEVDVLLRAQIALLWQYAGNRHDKTDVATMDPRHTGPHHPDVTFGQIMTGEASVRYEAFKDSKGTDHPDLFQISTDPLGPKLEFSLAFRRISHALNTKVFAKDKATRHARRCPAGVETIEVDGASVSIQMHIAELVLGAEILVNRGGWDSRDPKSRALVERLFSGIRIKEVLGRIATAQASKSSP